jgi:hypothetical protein
MKYAELNEDGLILGVFSRNRDGLSKVPNNATVGMIWDGTTLSTPPKSNDELFSKEMEELNFKYDSEMLKLSNEYVIAVARDASTESEKVLSVRSSIDNLDAQYEADQAALIQKYYGA